MGVGSNQTAFIRNFNFDRRRILVENPIFKSEVRLYLRSF